MHLIIDSEPKISPLYRGGVGGGAFVAVFVNVIVPVIKLSYPSSKI